MESPDIDPYKYNQLILTKAVKWREKKSFPQMVLEQMDIRVQKNKKERKKRI